MKYAQKDSSQFRQCFSRHMAVLIAGLLVIAVGCGGSASTPNPSVDNAGEATQATNPASTEIPAPPGGMELPSNFDVNQPDDSDGTGEPSGSGTSFELPE